MKVIIIEDEKPAAQKLQKAIAKCDGNIEVSAILSSTKDATAWLRENALPELIFLGMRAVKPRTVDKNGFAEEVADGVAAV